MSPHFHVMVMAVYLIAQVLSAQIEEGNKTKFNGRCPETKAWI
jgi:hypothetical protein